MWEFIDKVVYINLDNREDRRQIMRRFVDEGRIPDEKVMRYSAIKHSIGIVGCALSHIGVLKMARDNKWKSVLILEDDLQWINFDKGYKLLEETVSQQSWDVCLLTGLYIDLKHLKLKIGIYTNAYIVNQHYYDKLIHNMEEGLRKKLSPIAEPHIWNRPQMFFYKYIYPHIYNVDIYWVKLQQIDNWIAIEHMCRQTMVYSDINKDTIEVPILFDQSIHILMHTLASYLNKV
jgi:glycosyl transferase family 25